MSNIWPYKISFILSPRDRAYCAAPYLFAEMQIYGWDDGKRITWRWRLKFSFCYVLLLVLIVEQDIVFIHDAVFFFLARVCVCVCLLRKYWGLSLVTWRTLHSDTFPHIIRYFFIKEKMLSDFATAHPGQRPVTLIVANKTKSVLKIEGAYCSETLAKQLTCTRNSSQNIRIHISPLYHPK
jgi:hypothetical protein